ncbi:hypothetical protein [Stackebrandtia albiflava]|uniref:hypothetical protein n=1 Tax=Stackebrandtia albiflava TaxID=406432 RepID=UPI0011BDC2DD|nr:hypothetical protein [Stackebrandtia albiflava]
MLAVGAGRVGELAQFLTGPPAQRLLVAERGGLRNVFRGLVELVKTTECRAEREVGLRVFGSHREALAQRTDCVLRIAHIEQGGSQEELRVRHVGAISRTLIRASRQAKPRRLSLTRRTSRSRRWTAALYRAL